MFGFLEQLTGLRRNSTYLERTPVFSARDIQLTHIQCPSVTRFSIEWHLMMRACIYMKPSTRPVVEDTTQSRVLPKAEAGDA